MVLIVIITVTPHVQIQEVYVKTVLLDVSVLKVQPLKVQRVQGESVFSVEGLGGVQTEHVLRGDVGVTPTIMETIVK